MHGYEQFELLGQNVGLLAPNELRQPMQLEEIRRWNGLVRESTNLRKDGSRFPVWLMSEIVKDSEGEPTAIVTSCEDITSRKKAQEELEQHREHLEELVRERTTELTTANQNLQELNERLQTELLLAQKIQRGLLPPHDPQWSDLDVACYSTPAYEVGGDFFAYYQFDDSTSGEYALAVGDVSGKGMPAALLMAVSLASFQENVGQGLEPKALLEHLDEIIMPYTRTTIQNCALLYVEITLPLANEHGVARFVNAGCITPIIRRKQGNVEWIDVRGMPLGVGWGPTWGYQEVTLPIEVGDMLILTSDGVVEARDPDNQLLGFDRFEKFVRSGPQTSAVAMMDYLQTGVVEFMGEAELRDDLTIVVVRI